MPSNLFANIILVVLALNGVSVIGGDRTLIRAHSREVAPGEFTKRKEETLLTFWPKAKQREKPLRERELKRTRNTIIIHASYFEYVLLV